MWIAIALISGWVLGVISVIGYLAWNDDHHYETMIRDNPEHEYAPAKKT